MTWSIRPGESVGYIGANGAGKSTTIKMLCGILVPTTGTVRTCGFDPVRQRRQLARHIGVVFGQRSQLWWDLPLADSFRLLAAIHRLPTERATTRTDRAGRPARDGRHARHAGPAALARSADAGRGRGRVAALPRAADPRRAHHRARCRGEGAAARVPAARAPDPRHHPAVDHPRHGRHRAAVRAGAGGRSRPGRLRRRTGRSRRHRRHRATAGGRSRRADRRSHRSGRRRGSSTARPMVCVSRWRSTLPPRRPRPSWPRSAPTPKSATCPSPSPTSKTSSGASTSPKPPDTGAPAVSAGWGGLTCARHEVVGAVLQLRVVVTPAAQSEGGRHPAGDLRRAGGGVQCLVPRPDVP